MISKQKKRDLNFIYWMALSIELPFIGRRFETRLTLKGPFPIELACH